LGAIELYLLKEEEEEVNQRLRKNKVPPTKMI